MRKVILLILDGWGVRESSEHNAVKLSNPVNYNFLLENASWTIMNASEEWVGLPKGQMGNSEVGHTNIGAGRVVYQDFLRINKAVETGQIYENVNIVRFFEKLKKNGKSAHFLGLLSDGGVHSHIDHLKALVKMAKDFGVEKSYIHPFMDGRDTPPKSGINYINELQEYLNAIGYGEIATISGRYYAMDRDKRWDRVQKAYSSIIGADNKVTESPAEYILKSYKNDITDEFIEPASMANFKGVEGGDGIFFFNFRADRARELTTAITDKNFSGFLRDKAVNVEYITMTEYDEKFNFDIAFPPEDLINTLGEVISKNGLTQLRIAETEKYAHVTFFFNGGREIEFENEKRILIPSPKDVATYDKKPEMSVDKVVQEFENIYLNENIQLVVMNFANPDMVGHTGVEEAAIKACKAVDNALGKVIEVADKTNSVLIVTADHGNCEQMWDFENNQPHTAHTTNPVHFIVYNYDCKLKQHKDVKLADIAPTILDIMDISKPEQMTGESLIIK
ncbi:2,3-bisphosphoglycerate-independent phosphoglycerate mutase [Deferribacterales bacterium Es71-Z0220]|uniref:2,3-bisphosphoglycerate-independent phosphoglycerate mutase n=1 Tax=Deferrivibrio essentukiensis TaxID=2880922 RepID=UPI001F607B41|nr:2,3-bisphosphoglycerate-independent phosphoglycerate mutase [Deferrivibrio essentukiensis]MCB4203640.1 2,3-bisphosphoglycerate-independent phosphoglycerate mutase [Deferrivibrio essentukiensis]